VLCAARGEAVAAVDRLGAAGAERDLGFAPTTRASCREHFTGTGRVSASASAATAMRGAAAEVTTLCLASCAARGAASRLAELAIRVELLLARGECEFLVAVCANQSLVLSVQKTNSFSCGASEPFSPKTDEREFRVPQYLNTLLVSRSHANTLRAGCKNECSGLFAGEREHRVGVDAIAWEPLCTMPACGRRSHFMPWESY